MNTTLFLSLVSLMSSLSSAKPYKETVDRMTVDWSNMKIRFYGFAQKTTEKDLGEVAGQALSEGLLNIKSSVEGYHNNKLGKKEASPSGQEAGKLIARTTYAYHTEYFSDASVRVHMENALPRAFPADNYTFANPLNLEAAEGTFTGLVLRLDGKTEPRPVYQVVNEIGQVLFDITSVVKEAYEKNLMGKWYVNPTRGELASAVGAKPVSLEAKVIESGKYLVQGSAWHEALKSSQSLLSHSKIAVIVPE